ncbi:MAG: Rap1a/Tai family immunity protein [Cyanobacteria bacterium J06555_13]
MIRCFSLALAVSLFFNASANAFTDTAAEMIEICHKGETEKMVCQAFIAGVIYGFVDATELFRLRNNLENAPNLICPPTTWTVEEGLEILTSWADDNLELLKYSPSSAVLWAHSKAYPCN